MNAAEVRRAEGKLQAAKTDLVLDEPFFGALLIHMKFVVDYGCKTAWINGREMGYNPAFINSLSHEEIKALLVHEIEHVALGHPWRRDGRDHRRWNQACDKAINGDLKRDGYKLPADVLYPTSEEEGKSAEWIYTRMPEPEAQPQPQPEPEPEPGDEQGEGDGDGDEEGEAEGQPGDGDGDEEGEGEGNDDDGQGEGESEGDGDGQGQGDGKDGEGQPGQENGQGDGQGQPDPLGEVRDAPTEVDADGDPAPTEHEWKDRVMVAMTQAKMQGNMPGGAERQVGIAMRPRVDIRSLMLRFFTDRAASDYSWTRPSPRYLPSGLYLPALHEPGMGEVAVLVDTSGSVDSTSLQYARGILESVLDECHPAGITLYFVDTEVANTHRMERGEPLTWEPKGGGGTDFVSAFDVMEKAEPQPVAIVCITDLAATFPEHAPAIPTLWLTDTEHATAPFGETVFIDR